MSFFDKEYDRSKRKLIQLNKNTAVLLNLFYMEKEDELESLWYDEIAPDYPWHDIWKEAANEFVEQLRDHWCVYFLRCLRDKCDEEVQKWEKEHGESYRKWCEENKKRLEEVLNNKTEEQ